MRQLFALRNYRGRARDGRRHRLTAAKVGQSSDITAVAAGLLRPDQPYDTSRTRLSSFERNQA
ncbi:MAG: hypothetical protein ACRDWA_17435 [Acidimicrobiia bacterium]